MLAHQPHLPTGVYGRGAVTCPIGETICANVSTWASQSSGLATPRRCMSAFDSKTKSLDDKVREILQKKSTGAID